MLTLLGLETTLITFLGGRMAMVGFSIQPSTTMTPNPVTLQSINWACEVTRTAVATYGSPTDADLSVVASGTPTRILVDLSRLALLEMIVGNWNNSIIISESVSERSLSYADHLKDMEEQITQLRTDYAPQLKTVPVGASSGSIRHVPPTAFPPTWRPGFGGPRGYGSRRW